MDEGCVTIEPRQEHFKAKERDFLEGLRRIPARITNPPGVNPYAEMLNKPGRWLIAWIPEKGR